MNEIKKNIGGGLELVEPDVRNFEFGSIIGEEVNLNEIAGIDFMVGEHPIIEQGTSDYCTGYATALAGMFHEGVELSPEWTFSKIKQLIGTPDGFGAPLGTAMKAGIVYGFLEKKRAPLSREKNGDAIRNWGNWDSFLDAYAREHKQQSYFEVKQGEYLDLFDALRAALWQEKDTAIVTGAMWRDEWTSAENGIIPEVYGNGGYGHAFCLIGQKILNGEPYLIAQLSNGTDIGDNGRFYFSRAVVNKELKYGSFMFVDMPKEEAKYYSEKKLKANQIAYARFLFAKYFRRA